MHLLIVTQIVDPRHPVLGFFHQWIRGLARCYEHVTVIALKVGEHDLPGNVHVRSLGKEHGASKVRCAIRFFKYIWEDRQRYDAVFVHMNQEYVLLGGLFWRFLGKRTYLWRNHYAGNTLTDIASIFCTKVFCTSKYSYTARYKKKVLMPVGVDIGSCHPEEEIQRRPRSVLFLGRLDESKQPHILLEALGILASKGIDFTATFVGGPSDPKSKYPNQLRDRAEKLEIIDRIKFIGAVPNTETYRYYRTHDIFVNCSKSGMLDKTIFKAAACGCLVIAASLDWADFVGGMFVYKENNVEQLTSIILHFLDLSSVERIRLSNILKQAIKQHSLNVLMSQLVSEMSL